MTGCTRPYAAFVSADAARATQMLEIVRHAAGQDDTPITAATGLRSSVGLSALDAAGQLVTPARSARGSSLLHRLEEDA